ncbi:MAG: putative quinol monooxygenase [Thermoleophilia bacterium]
MSEITVLVLARAKPGRGDDAQAAFQEVAVPTHAEAGCILYALHRVTGDPERLVLIERWESREALDAHLATDHLTEFRAGSADLWESPPEIILIEPAPAGDPVKGSLAGA